MQLPLIVDNSGEQNINHDENSSTNNVKRNWSLTQEHTHTLQIIHNKERSTASWSTLAYAECGEVFQATDAHFFHMLSQIQRFLISHAEKRTHMHTYTFIVFRAVLPEYALTFILSAVTSLLPHQIVRKFKHTGMRIHTHRGKTPSNSQETELVLEFSPKRPWMTSVV